MTLTTHAPSALRPQAFFRSYVTTMRPYLLFVSGIVGLTGLAMGPALPLAATLLLGAVYFLSYGFGQALTDCFQTDTDALSAPYRPLVRGEIGRRDVLLASVAGLLLCGAVITAFNPANAVLAAAMAFGLYSYTWFKRRWWGGPLWNAWIVAALALSALASAGAPAVSTAALAGTLGAVLFGYANFVLTGYWKDLSADAATGYRTLPVVFGTARAALVSDGFALLEIAGVIAAVAAVPSPATDLLWALTFLAPGLVQTLRAQRALRRVSEQTADLAIAPQLHGYLLLLSGIVALLRPAWTPALWLFFVLWVVALRLRPVARQI